MCGRAILVVAEGFLGHGVGPEDAADAPLPGGTTMRSGQHRADLGEPGLVADECPEAHLTSELVEPNGPN
jgi:hypothetical protein